MSKDAIIAATRHYCTAPSTQTLAALEALLAQDAPACMRQCQWVLEALNTVLAEEGQQLAEIFRQQGTQVVCGAGCAGCCHQMVLCQPFEAQAIVTYINAHPTVKEAFLQRYAAWDTGTAPYRQSYLAWAAQRYTHGEDTGAHALGDYAAPCPFLDAQDTCIIYPVRPYGCRTCIAVNPACPQKDTAEYGAHQLQFTLYTQHHATRMELTHMLVRCLGAGPATAPMQEVVATLLARSGERAPDRPCPQAPAGA